MAQVSVNGEIDKLDINLDEALGFVLEKYNKRLAKGSAGSENE
jgi:hypothetical protein